MKAWIRLALIALPCACLAACGGVQARTPAIDPALSTPAPPPRVIVPATIVIPEPDPPAQVPAPSRPTPPASRPAERPAQPVTPPAGAAAEPPASSTPPQVLQATSNVGDLEAKTRAALAKANGDLARVNPSTLGADAHAQYDTARSFIRQADEAMQAKNLRYAKELADKAAALAGLLIR